MPNYSYQGKLSLYPYDPRYTAIAPPTAGIFDEPQMSVCFNVEWAAHIDGVLSRLLWTDAWAGTPETQQWAVAQMTSLLVSMMARNPCGGDCMSECCDDIVEQLEEIKALLIAKAKPTAKETRETINQVEEDYQTRIEEIEAVYDDDITNVHPEIAYGDADDPIRDQALCFICQRFVDICCDWIVQNIQLKVANQQTVLNIAALIGAGSDLLGRIFAETAFGTMFENIDLVLELEVQALSAWITTVTEDQLSIYQDTDARKAVACEWYDGLKGATPTLSLFLSSLTDATLTGNADTIRTKLLEALTPVDVPQTPDGEKLYFIWSDLWQEAYDGTQAGIVPDCLCDDEEPVDPGCQDLVASDNGWYPSPNTGFGDYDAGLGPKAGTNYFSWNQDALGTGAQTIIEIVVRLNMPVTDLRIYSQYGSCQYSGAATDTVTVNATSHPTQLPWADNAYTGITTSTNIAPSSAFRVIEVCIHYAE